VSDVELVVTDLDGTLWDAQERIHERTLDALRTLERRGVPVLVATGRRKRSAAEALARESLQLPAVVLDGALGVDLRTDTVFHSAAFEPHAAVAVLEAFAAAGMSPCVYVDRPEADVVVSDSPSTHPRHLQLLGRWAVRGDLREVVATEPVLAIGVVGLPAQALLPVAAQLDGVAATAVTRDIILGSSTLIVRPRGISKWQGVEAFCRLHQLDPARVLALGDGENDVELLTAAAVACVVSDGCDAALALADHVIDPAAAGGWCKVLELC
jgi:hydroxymethylpyrimidine pyrophosphatase-like HAD family hydrolase